MVAGKEGWTIVGLLFAVAIVFRIIALDHLPGINGDEAYYGWIVMGLKAGEARPLRSGSGLPLNPLYTGLLYLIQLVWPTPSFWVLRLPALLSGLAAAALAYPLLSRVLDRATAVATALLLACLPIAIAYSRFGWDQSQAPLMSLLCLYFALNRQLFGTTGEFIFALVCAVAAFVVALIVHPLNIFLAPVLVGVVIGKIVSLPVEERSVSRRRLGVVLLVGALLCAIAVSFLLTPEMTALWHKELAPNIGHRLISASGWGEYIVLYGDLLSGITIYRYITGPVPDWSLWLHRGLFWGLTGVLLLRGLPRLIRQRECVALGLLGGLAVSLIAFYVVLGQRPMGPGLERYAMYLIVPSCLALVLLGRSLSDTSPHGWQIGGGLVICGMLLLAFYGHYFQPLATTGGEQPYPLRTFRTGPVEPKQAAFDFTNNASDGPATLLAADWWCYRPIQYLAYQRPDFEVLLCRKPEGQSIDVTTPRRRFFVAFAGGTSEAWMREHASELPRTTIMDYSGRPVLYVWDLGTATELLPGVIEAARSEPPD
jgi:hypothetical protein